MIPPVRVASSSKYKRGAAAHFKGNFTHSKQCMSSTFNLPPNRPIVIYYGSLGVLVFALCTRPGETGDSLGPFSLWSLLIDFEVNLPIG